MQRSKVNFAVDLATMVGMFGLIATGLVLEWVLPPGSGGRGGGLARMLWGGTRHGWGDVHFYVACGLTLLILVHIALHWTWICTRTVRFLTHPAIQTNTSKLRRNLAGIGCMLTVVSVFSMFTWIASENVVLREPVGNGAPRPRREQMNANIEGLAGSDQNRHGPTVANAAVVPPTIRGSMTLAEAAAARRMSSDELKFSLGLPKSVSDQTRLGELCREYAVSMSEIRRALPSVDAVPPIRPPQPVNLHP